MARSPKENVSYELKSDLRFIRGIVSLGIKHRRLQYPIQPGRIGLLNVGGRITDRYGRPSVFIAGERPAADLFASRLYGIPGLGYVEQEVIEFAVNPGRITLTLSRPLSELLPGTGDLVVIEVHVDVRLGDPFALIQQLPDWRDPGGVEASNRGITNRVRDSARQAIRSRWRDWIADETYLATDAPHQIQAAFRTILEHTFADWGLLFFDGVPPIRELPSALTEIIYAIRRGEIELEMAVPAESADAALIRQIVTNELRKTPAESTVWNEPG